MAGTLSEEVVHTGDSAVFGDNDHLHARGVAHGEVYFLLAVGSDGHAGQSHIGFAAFDGFGNGVEFHVVNLQFQSQFAGDGSCDLGVNAYDIAALHVLVGREGRIGGHGEFSFHGGGKAVLIVSVTAV